MVTTLRRAMPTFDLQDFRTSHVFHSATELPQRTVHVDVATSSCAAATAPEGFTVFPEALLKRGETHAINSISSELNPRSVAMAACASSP